MTDVRIARSGDVDVAYRVVGDGPIDLVYAQGQLTHLEICWELPQFRRYCERLAEFTRLILFDKRGMGMSDRVPGATTLDERMDDIRAILDAVGSERAAVMGESEGGPLAMLFAAAHPERTAALILQGAEVRERTDEEWPWGESTDEEFEAAMATLPERWGLGLGIDNMAPSVAGQEWARAWRARVVTNACTPAAAEAFMRMAFDIDVRHVAPAINVPTLIVHSADDQICNVENGRFLARTIPGARYVELPDVDHVAWFNPEPTVAEIREFLTGQREAATRTAFSRRCCSRTSSARPSAQQSWAIAAGAISWSITTRRCGASWPASTVTSRTLPATGSSRRSTGRRARSAAPRRSSTHCGRSISMCAPVSTRERSSCTTARWRGSPSTSAPGSRAGRAGGSARLEHGA